MKPNYIEETIAINGIKEYMIHYQGEKDAPVVLFLHGGPGSSESVFAYYIESGWSGNYTSVYYDQRGSGKTYYQNKNAIPTMDNLKEDLLQTVLYVKEKYQTEKIVILGHSFGTVLGSMFAIEHPEHVLCYIGVGQVIDIIENEKVCYSKLAGAIDGAENEKDKEKLSAIGVYPPKSDDQNLLKKMNALRKMQGKYNLGMKIDWHLIKLILKSPVVGWSEISGQINGMKVNDGVFRELWDYSLYAYNRQYAVPVYYILGENDNETPTEIAVKYFETIIAPEKQLYLIKNAGHMTMLDNLKDYQIALNDVLERNS
ncbi:alpha/beta fold hydrolase [Acetobacterium paludosum]|uniref:prolyl aminopeptidase n=1 Tax=Acetobacterium paludosum TaxID=52693 RepID=A0A923HWL6_9FIRM|nr:alpha/beta hydrolase [Acetobacterium paludosum]MBC3889859.1 alpha/beta fold hydrolase [Acetobacterium paludosum]